MSHRVHWIVLVSLIVFVLTAGACVAPTAPPAAAPTEAPASEAVAAATEAPAEAPVATEAPCR